MDAVKNQMEPFKKYIGKIEYDANFYAVIIALIAVLITIVSFYFLKKKRANRRSVLITGLSDAGKTLLFSKVIASKRVVTYASMKENVAVYRPEKKKSVTVVDIPGNERLRSKYIEQFLPTTRGIIFVIDSFMFQKEIRDVASFLYSLLQEPEVHDYRIPFLVACNKQDHAVSKSAKVIQSQLEKEINLLRTTQSGRLSSSENKVYLGSRGKEFQFSDLRGIRIEFLECSALEDEDSGIVEGVQTWLLKIA